MEKKLTPIQELIEFMNREDVRYVDQCVNKAKQLLELEKKQIIEAYKKGVNDKRFNRPEYVDADKYYTETFKS